MTTSLGFREATVEDIHQIQRVRHSVKENILSDPSKVTDADCEEFILRKGKGWVCEADGKIVGFAVADLQGENIWALFILPEYERNGIGKRLHQMMLNWYFGQKKERVWLSTDPGTRAEKFYRLQGWRRNGMKDGELLFEISRETWEKLHRIR